ncbi:MAG: SDR family oxidoreductase [Candidatus Omnitrophota bacterium]
MKRFFITGGTGFLGKALIKKIIAEKGSEVYALTRGKGMSLSSRKNALIRASFPESKRKSAAKRIHLVKGDVSLKNMGMSGKDLKCLRGKITHAYHSAGIVGFNENLSDIRKTNVEGAKNFFSVMEDWSGSGNLTSINHISTAYVRGTYKGKFREDQLEVSQKFNNTYEKSKFEAEQVVETYRKKGMRINVFRPSLITRLSQGKMEEDDLGQRITKMIMFGFLKTLPLDKKATVNMVPVEMVSGAVYFLSVLPDRTLNKNFHLVNPRPVKFSTFLTVFSSVWGFTLPEFVPADKFKTRDLAPVQQKLIGAFLPYMTQAHSFDMKNTVSAIKGYGIQNAYFFIKKTRRKNAS